MHEAHAEFSSLMARVCCDDSQALARLIALYEPQVLRAAQVLLSRVLRSSLDPTDLVQSVHLQLILGLKQGKLAIDNTEQLRSLAVTLLRHKVIEQWRRHRRQARHQIALASQSAPSDEIAAVAVRERDPARAAEYKDLLDHLYRQLGSDERRLVIMRLQGYRTGEIAKELGIDPTVLRMRLSRLRRRLLEKKPPTEWV